jgi:hAT family C-terminal dimerisation region
MDSALQKLEKYTSLLDVSPYYAMALILHPAHRTRWIQNYWEKERAEKAIRFAQHLWEKHRDKPLLYASIINEPIQLSQRSRTKGKEQKEKQNQNAFQRIKEQRNQSSRPKSLDEYEDFCIETSYDPGILPLQWWLQDIQKKRFPKLSILAIEIFSIPAMSAEPERIFSGGRRTIRWDRASLSIETLEMLECQKDWMKRKFPINIIE